MSYFGRGISPFGHGTTNDHAYMDFRKFQHRSGANFCNFYGHEERKKKRAILPEKIWNMSCALRRLRVRTSGPRGALPVHNTHHETNTTVQESGEKYAENRK